MRVLSILFGAILLTLIGTRASAAQPAALCPWLHQRAPASATAQENRQPAHSPSSYTCRIVTGYGTAIGRGSTALQAKENAREICGSKIIDQYYAQRGQIGADVEDDLALACVNLECQ
jgi:hypothetical protein